MPQSRPPHTDRAPVVVSSAAGSFAQSVLLHRHPALIERVRGATAYQPQQQRALDVLLREITEDVIEPLGKREPDAALWQRWGQGHVGRRWTDVPFLWAESFFYRKLLAALGYFTPGAWQGVDPFAPFKHAELTDPKTDAELTVLDGIAQLSLQQRDIALLHASLWGNRADLGFQLSAGDAGLGERVAGLVSDGTEELWHLLEDRQPGRVSLVADNAGPELLPDLVLTDHLLETGRATSVSMHIKPYPYYISDAVTTDVLACLERMAAAGGHAATIAERLRRAVREGRLVLRAHPFSCAPFGYADMPDDLREDFGTATLTLMKGDLNYRRLVGDRHWPATVPFDEVTAHFPGPVAALRTLKSDVITGLSERTVAELDATGDPWRTSGTHALVQVSAG